MNASTFLGYGIIGTSDGFAAQTAGLLADVDIGSIVDLDNRQIFAPFGTEIIAGFREERDGHFYSYFVLYRYAVEQERSRLGGFYGSVVALKDCTADGFAIYSLLLELATNVKVYLDPESSRFLVPMEEITFLHPNSIDEVVRSVKKQSVHGVIPAGYFAPLPPHSRNSFRFIDFFQHDPSGMERFFISQDQEVLELVKKKAGLKLKSLILEKAEVEKKLEQADQIDTEIFIKEKELENIREQHSLALVKLAELEEQQNKLNLQLDNLSSDIKKLNEKKHQFEKELEQLEKDKAELIRQCQSLMLRRDEPEFVSGKKPSNTERTQTPQKHFNLREQMGALHPLTRMLVLVLAFVGLGAIGYLTITGFGNYREVWPKKEAFSSKQDEFSSLEKQINEEYRVFNKVGQDSFLARLSPYLTNDQADVREKAEKLRQYILSIGYHHYQQELKRTDTIPVLHSQLVEEFEILKSQYDSVFVNWKITDN